MIWAIILLMLFFIQLVDVHIDQAKELGETMLFDTDNSVLYIPLPFCSYLFQILNLNLRMAVLLVKISLLH